ncbi:bifunctional (p)ppGpp synthetase/guanosine-3',5'-bis(diphosphate) 3'-pyrophosphohydrolase [Candidatus Uhrbacteria bacterium]|nr:bifunctional (p)ppGpp synthetase/guanosine-3',5'-bis(diphosphate) 3'-pyrophosphohydrolase [Candidatus Uhrbacteria bacterium]
MSLSPEKLLEKIAVYNPGADLNMVRLAFEYARDAHEGQNRMSGDPYIIHPLRTAELLADMQLPTSIIIAGLLHDVPEDTKVTLDDIRRDFGEDIASMVAGITKLGKIKYRGMERYIENLRKMFVAMASDLRVILIKFADRINNLETLDSLPPEKRARIALESLEIYAPIANRLGMGEIKGKIEDLSFRHVLPKEYERIRQLLAETISIKKNYIAGVSKILEGDLKANAIPYLELSGRTKHLYSLYRKLQKYEDDISKIHDLIALRVIMPNVGDCYAALGIIHHRWKPLKGRIKDYIAQPKPNGYQSLHTTVFCEDGEIVEFQIRTKEMHDAAERGIAAHWQYDEDGKKVSSAMKKQLTWVKELADLQRDLEDADKFLEDLEMLKIDVFQNRIFVFTPKGDVIDLPEGATPVDFAYAIHTQVGNKCVGARINDKIVSLDTKLSSGDYCDVITDKNRKGPSADWLTFVKTHHARSQIRSQTKAKLTDWMKNIGPGEKK